MNTKREDIFLEIRELLMEGTPRPKIVVAICEKFGFKTRAGYKWLEKFMTSDEFFKDRDALRGQLKTSLFHMFNHSYSKGWTRSALEVLDRMMQICPWLKETVDENQIVPIKIEIVEHSKSEDDEEKPE